jgi:hypothetical protein
MKPFSVAAAVWAGAAGGTAELLWVAAYSAATPASGIEVARQVAATALPATAGLASAPVIGVAVHMALSIALGVAVAKLLLGLLVPTRHGGSALLAGALAVLAAVWAVNFFVILPLVNPAFVTLLPFAVTLVSKLLFGLAMGLALVGRGGTA